MPILCYWRLTVRADPRRTDDGRFICQFRYQLFEFVLQTLSALSARSFMRIVIEGKNVNEVEKVQAEKYPREIDKYIFV